MCQAVLTDDTGPGSEVPQISGQACTAKEWQPNEEPGDEPGAKTNDPRRHPSTGHGPAGVASAGQAGCVAQYRSDAPPRPARPAIRAP